MEEKQPEGFKNYHTHFLNLFLSKKNNGGLLQKALISNLLDSLWLFTTIRLIKARIKRYQGTGISSMKDANPLNQ